MRNLLIEFKWAIVFTIAMLAWMLLEKTLGWHDEYIENHYLLTLLYIPVAVLFYILEMREKRRRYFNGTMTWLQGFLSGLMLSVFITILSPIAQYITLEYITPNFLSNMITHAVQSGSATQAEAEAYFNIQSYMVQAAIGAIAMGTITSAFVAIFVRKKGQ